MTDNSLFLFKKLDTIGNLNAESDGQFLFPCFVDNGELEILRNCDDERGIVLGRTGAGKTALLKMLQKKEERVILLDPHDLALSYISNSTVIRFFEALNIRMDAFYKLLWKHVLLVELIKRCLDLKSELDNLSLIDYIRMRFKKRAYKEAFDYLTTWGDTFWENTEERIKEITKKVETDLKASADVSIQDLMKMGVEGTRQLSEEQRKEIFHRGQEVMRYSPTNR